LNKHNNLYRCFSISRRNENSDPAN